MAKKEDVTEEEFKALIHLLNSFEEALIAWSKIRTSVIRKTKKRPILQLDLFTDEEE